VTTDDDDVASRVRLLSYHGMSRDSWERYSDRGSWYYQVEVPGYKCNMNDVQAAMGLSQLDKIDGLLERRRAIARRFSDGLSSSPFFELPSVRDGNEHTWHLYVVRLNLENLRIGRDQFIAALTEENIGSSVHFIPVYTHPFFAEYLREGASFPVSEEYYARCLSLPLYPGMSDADNDDVVAALTKIATYYGVA
jgi:dTDP-4-amino-4,6-dideoxygalactose transaminase